MTFSILTRVNPNQASAVPANLVLPAALNSVAELYDQPDNFSLYLSVAWACGLSRMVMFAA